MDPRPSSMIDDLDGFYAHACAMEREAAERYGEFADYFADHGEPRIAALCRALAVLEDAHRQRLRLRAGGDEPALPAEDRWLDAGAPETAAHEFVYRVANPRQVLEIALAGELRAKDYFDHVAAESPDPAVRRLAAALASEEQEHAHWVEEALARAADPDIDWERYFGDDAGDELD
jgi:rubrerythrin